MISRIGCLSVALLCLWSIGCSLDLTQLESAPQDINACEETADCRVGLCSLGRCVAEQGNFDTVLLEITPPSSAPRVGGVRFLQTLNGMDRSGRRDIALRPPALVTGYVKAYDVEALEECLDDTTDSLPMEVTLIPRSRILGLPSSSYTTKTIRRPLTDAEAARHPCNRETSTRIKPGMAFHGYTLTVPAGEYDIYVRSALAEDAERSCKIVPYLRRQLDIPAGNVCWILEPRAPELFSARIEWPGSEDGQTLDGWKAEIVHPVTGEVLSTSQRLGSSDAAGEAQDYDFELSYSRADGADYASTNEELLRLTPPEPHLGPVIQLSLQPLDPFGDDQNLISDLKPFPAPVQLETWIWEKAELDLLGREVGVPASVTFTATQLDGISNGVFASFSTTVESAADGRLSATVLPGEYRVRVVPEVGSGLAATEDTLTVSCERSPSDSAACLPRRTSDGLPRIQAGRTILVPPAAAVSGRVRLFDVSGSLRDATVDARPGQIRARRCATEQDAGECKVAPLDVLEVSLGEQAFIPRSDSALTDHRGNFSMRLDCGTCDEDGGAVFDISVRPQLGAGYPWLVSPGRIINSDTKLGDIKLPLPIIQRGVVQIPQGSGDPVRVPGALIRAYIHRDALGRYVADPAERPSCGAELADARCLRSILQIGEARAAADGSYELALPSRLE